MHNAVLTDDATMQVTVDATDVANNEDDMSAKCQNKKIDKGEGPIAIIHKYLLEWPNQIIAIT